MFKMPVLESKPSNPGFDVQLSLTDVLDAYDVVELKKSKGGSLMFKTSNDVVSNIVLGPTIRDFTVKQMLNNSEIVVSEMIDKATNKPLLLGYIPGEGGNYWADAVAYKAQTA